MPPIVPTVIGVIASIAFPLSYILKKTPSESEINE